MRALWRLAVGIWITGLVLLGTTSVAAEQGSHNLVLVTIDTVRADYLSCNGSTKVRTPHLDALARGGVNFTRTRASVPLTLPSHASILMASYPLTHTVRDNGSFLLPEDRLTLPEVLANQGYETAAFIGSFVLDRRFGLAQGFDLYDDRTWSDVSMLENLEAERNAGAVFAVFDDWLDQRGERSPFFAWVHLYDPHAPYEPPELYRSRYPNDPYAGEVAYADDIIGRIVGELETQGLGSQTIVAVIGDHGEGLGEHEEGTHSLLIYNSTLHVPMLIRAPGLIPEGKVVDRLTRTIDLAPTLLDLMGIAVDLGEGVSLRHLIEVGEGIEPDEPSSDRPVYSESLYPRLHLGWSELRALESGDYKLIQGPEQELYDMVRDPRESENLVAQQPQIVTELQRQLEQLTAGDAIAEAASIDPEAIAKLRSLGYLSGSDTGPTALDEGASIDPKSKMADWARIQRGIFEFSRGNHGAAASIFEEVLATNTDVLLVYDYLGSSYMGLEQWSRAERVYREALAKGLVSAQFHLDLGLIHEHRGEAVPAMRELRAALAIDSTNVTARFHLGNLLRRAGRMEQAIEQYRQAIGVNPDYVYAWNGLGMTLAAVDRQPEALAAFRRVVEIDPVGARGYFNLAVQLERMRRPAEAVVAYEDFLARAEGDEFSAERARAVTAIERLRSPD
ncbi:MAG: tetratricopeptide repeat protein [Acidobacteria bacterium]|nr:MAG: tetratricopeptide repeat protein [Acidobacteriota bacterium]